ncbi:protein D3-like [Diadema setosum]|uniref:protein D3-like n=1 Tax=Diadema setosum TaxID=31175 RepID=UPI003B3AF81B
MDGYREYDIVPEVLDEVPPEVLSVTWPSSGVRCELGNELTPTQVQRQPALDWQASEDSLYTVLFVHVGSPTIQLQVCHWIVFNVPGNDVNKGLVHAEYLESGPPKDTGIHTYLYLIYKQPSTLPITPKDAYRRRVRPERRKPWSTRDFARQYDLGNPVAGNFYRAQYDDYVPIFQWQVHGKKIDKS